MKLENKAAEAFVSQKVETHTASISMTKEVFNILVKGIYKDPFLAVVREYTCNGRDGQVEAGNNVPLTIHLPTCLEPWFSVKDYGVGMSKQMVTKTFMELGNSTKRERNDLVGAKGIGSKSAFSITDSFSVISAHEGVKTSYSIYMNKGIPDIAVLTSNKTEEPNGVEVKIAVATDKVSTLNNAALEFFSLFDYPYNVNIPDFKEKAKYPGVAFSKEVDGFVVQILSDADSELTDKVIMGGVGYSSAYLRDKTTEDILVIVPIGAVDISPGREYTEEIDNPEFVKKLEEVISEVTEEYYAEVLNGLLQLDNILEVTEYYGNQTSKGKIFIIDYFNKTYGLCSKVTSYKERRKAYRYKFCGGSSEVDFGEVLSGNLIFMVKDKSSSLCIRAEHLSSLHSKKVVYSVDYDFYLLREKFFSGIVYFASEVNLQSDKPKEKKERAPRIAKKGHVVYTLSNVGVNKERLSKEDFSKIKNHLIKSEGSHQDSICVESFGWISHAHKDMPKDNGVDVIYLLSERQIAWAKNSVEFKPKLSSEHKSKIQDNLLIENGYNDVINKISHLKKVKGVSGKFRAEKSKTSISKWIKAHFCEVIQEVDNRARKITEQLNSDYIEEKKKLLDHAPMLKYIPEKDWQEKDIKDYVKLTGASNAK